MVPYYLFCEWRGMKYWHLYVKDFIQSPHSTFSTMTLDNRAYADTWESPDGIASTGNAVNQCEDTLECSISLSQKYELCWHCYVAMVVAIATLLPVYRGDSSFDSCLCSDSTASSFKYPLNELADRPLSWVTNASFVDPQSTNDRNSSLHLFITKRVNTCSKSNGRLFVLIK